MLKCLNGDNILQENNIFDKSEIRHTVCSYIKLYDAPRTGVCINITLSKLFKLLSAPYLGIIESEQPISIWVGWSYDSRKFFIGQWLMVWSVCLLFRLDGRTPSPHSRSNRAVEPEPLKTYPDQTKEFRLV